jgi:hypothetical protein
MSKVQSYLFLKSYYDINEVNDYINSHDIHPIKAIHETDNMFRVRVQDPKQFKKFRTKKLSNHLEAVIGFY